MPQVASADGGNTTFFVSDNARDADTQPNFFGTSASAPHAASIAALALQRAGGPRSVTPDRMRKRLQNSAFQHDLDPFGSQWSRRRAVHHRQGTAGLRAGRRARPDERPEVLHGEVRRQGAAEVDHLLGETASPTALGTRNEPLSDGIVFDNRPFDGVSPFRTDGFPFTIGSTSGGLSARKVSAAFSVPGGGQSVAGQFRHLTLNFKSGLKRGQALQFGVDRDLAISGFGGSNEGNGADELGGATFLPQNIAVRNGLEFVAQRADGRWIRGAMRNRLGSGWTPIDGYGVINAEKAVLGR